MPILSATTIRRLRQVRAAILAHPKLYSQGSVTCANESCGTPACILGWANTLFPKTSKRQRAKAMASWLDRNKEDPYITLLQPAARRALIRGTAALHLTAEQANSLWMDSGWPYRFRKERHLAWCDFDQFERRLALARIAARRITHFIKTDGRE